MGITAQSYTADGIVRSQLTFHFLHSADISASVVETPAAEVITLQI